MNLPDCHSPLCVAWELLLEWPWSPPMELKIIWRNPQPVRHIQRWESVEKAPDRSVYVVQEYVLEGEGDGYWATECEFQVIRGGHAA